MQKLASVVVMYLLRRGPRCVEQPTAMLASETGIARLYAEADNSASPRRSYSLGYGAVDALTTVVG